MQESEWQRRQQTGPALQDQQRQSYGIDYAATNRRALGHWSARSCDAKIKDDVAHEHHFGTGSGTDAPSARECASAVEHQTRMHVVSRVSGETAVTC